MSSRSDRIRAIEQAEKFVKSGKIKEAIAEFEKLVQADPQDVGTLNIIGDLYQRIHQNDKAVRSFLRVAEEYEKRGLFSQALAIFKKIHKTDPDNADHSLKLADLYAQQGFLSDAKNEYLAIAARLLKDRKPADAIQVYEKISRLDREDIEVKKELARLYLEQGFLDASTDQLNEIAELLTARGDFDGAEAVLKEALALSPTGAKGLVNLVEIYRKQKLNAKAIDLIETTLKDTPDNVQLLNLLGNIYFEEGDVKKAEEIFTRIVTGHPANVNARIKLGRIQILKDKLDQAFELFEPLITNLIKKHRDEKAIGLLGLILESHKPHLPALERLAGIYRTNKEVKKLEVVLRAMLDELRRQGERQKMLAILSELKQLRADDIEIAVEYRDIRRDLGLPEEEHVEEEGGLSAKDREAIQETIAQADLYMQQGLVRNARRILENLRFRYPDDPQIQRKIAVLDEIRTHIDEEELRRRVEKATALETRIKERSAERKAEERKRTFGPFAGEAPDVDKMSTADIFAETDIIPFVTSEGGERRYYDLAEQAAAEIRLLKAVHAQQLQGAAALSERELANIVSDFKRDLKVKVGQDDHETHFELGVAFMEQGLFGEAIEELALASKERSLALDCYGLIGQCYRRSGDFQDAEKWLKKALGLAKEGSDQSYALEFEMAELRLESGDREKALSIFRKIRDWNPGYRNISSKVESLEPQAE